MNGISRTALIPAALLIVAVFAGCLGTSVPLNFWVLSELEGEPAVSQTLRRVAVGPVILPEYMQRPEVVRRLTPNQLDVAESDQWAQSPEDLVGSTLARNLEILVPGTRAARFPWRGGKSPDFELSVKATRFEADADGTVHLDAEWELVRPSRREVVVDGSVRVREPLRGAGYEEIAAAMSRALGTLSRDVASEVSSASLQ